MWRCLWRRLRSGPAPLRAARRRPATHRRPWRPSRRRRLCRTTGCRRRPRWAGRPTPSRPWPRLPRRTARGRMSQGRPACRARASRSIGSPALGEAGAPAGSAQAKAAALLSHSCLCICEVSSSAVETPEAPAGHILNTCGCRMQPCLHGLNAVRSLGIAGRQGAEQQQAPVVSQ